MPLHTLPPPPNQPLTSVFVDCLTTVPLIDSAASKVGEWYGSTKNLNGWLRFGLETAESGARLQWKVASLAMKPVAWSMSKPATAIDRFAGNHFVEFVNTRMPVLARPTELLKEDIEISMRKKKLAVLDYSEEKVGRLVNYSEKKVDRLVKSHVGSFVQRNIHAVLCKTDEYVDKWLPEYQENKESESETEEKSPVDEQKTETETTKRDEAEGETQADEQKTETETTKRDESEGETQAEEAKTETETMKTDETEGETQAEEAKTETETMKTDETEGETQTEEQKAESGSMDLERPNEPGSKVMEVNTLSELLDITDQRRSDLDQVLVVDNTLELGYNVTNKIAVRSYHLCQRQIQKLLSVLSRDKWDKERIRDVCDAINQEFRDVCGFIAKIDGQGDDKTVIQKIIFRLERVRVALRYLMRDRSEEWDLDATENFDGQMDDIPADTEFFEEHTKPDEEKVDEVKPNLGMEEACTSSGEWSGISGLLNIDLPFKDVLSPFPDIDQLEQAQGTAAETPGTSTAKAEAAEETAVEETTDPEKPAGETDPDDTGKSPKIEKRDKSEESTEETARSEEEIEKRAAEAEKPKEGEKSDEETEIPTEEAEVGDKEAEKADRGDVVTFYHGDDDDDDDSN